MADKDPSQGIRLLKEWLSGGLANAITSALLNPMDVTKTRMQTALIDTQLSLNRIKLPSNHNLHLFKSTISGLYREGGVVGLWTPGLLASCIRELLSSGPRAGFYVPVRDTIRDIVAKLYNDKTASSAVENSFSVKALAAMTTGTMGSILANPIDVVKIRLMTNPNAYQSTLSAIPIIFRMEGLAGLYKGVVPSTLRGAFIAAGELATYDHSKHLIKAHLQISEGVHLHSFASLITGFVAATVAAPFDMIKTRYTIPSVTCLVNFKLISS
jgi:hypothetical protein